MRIDELSCLNNIFYSSATCIKLKCIMPVVTTVCCHVECVSHVLFSVGVG